MANRLADAMGSPYGPTIGANLWNTQANGFVNGDGAGGGWCWEANQAGGGATTAYKIIQTTSDPSIFSGFHYKLNNLPASGTEAYIYGIGDDLGDIFYFTVNSVGAVSFYILGTRMHITSAGILLPGLENKIEYNVLFDPTNGMIEMVLNGLNTVFTTSSDLNTCPTGRNTVSLVRIGNPNGLLWSAIFSSPYSNMYLNDGDGYEGVCFILEDVPNGDGTTDWTPSTGTTGYNLVNSIPPDTTKYVTTSTLHDVETFTFPNLSSGVQSISRSAINCYIQKTGAGGRGVSGYMEDTSDTSLTATLNEIALADGFQFISFPFENDPITSGSLTPSTLNNKRLGIKVTS